MTHRTQLEIGQSGYVNPGQLWLVRSGPGPKRLYVEPRFVSKDSATPDMLHVTRMQNTAAPERNFYAILLPPAAKFRVAHTLPNEGDAQRAMVRIRRILIQGKTPTDKPFATVPDFYFS